MKDPAMPVSIATIPVIFEVLLFSLQMWVDSEKMNLWKAVS